MEPTIGRTVIYKTSEADRRKMEAIGITGKGINSNARELPAVVVAVWGPDMVNLKVLLSGQGDIWKTSVHSGDQEGTWSWPVILPVKSE